MLCFSFDFNYGHNMRNRQQKKSTTNVPIPIDVTSKQLKQLKLTTNHVYQNKYRIVIEKEYVGSDVELQQPLGLNAKHIISPCGYYWKHYHKRDIYNSFDWYQLEKIPTNTSDTICLKISYISLYCKLLFT